MIKLVRTVPVIKDELNEVDLKNIESAFISLDSFISKIDSEVKIDISTPLYKIFVETKAFGLINNYEKEEHKIYLAGAWLNKLNNTTLRRLKLMKILYDDNAPIFRIAVDGDAYNIVLSGVTITKEEFENNVFYLALNDGDLTIEVYDEDTSNNKITTINFLAKEYSELNIHMITRENGKIDNIRKFNPIGRQDNIELFKENINQFITKEKPNIIYIQKLIPFEIMLGRNIGPTFTDVRMEQSFMDLFNLGVFYNIVYSLALINEIEYTMIDKLRTYRYCGNCLGMVNSKGDKINTVPTMTVDIPFANNANGIHCMNCGNKVERYLNESEVLYKATPIFKELEKNRKKKNTKKRTINNGPVHRNYASFDTFDIDPIELML